MSQNPYGNDYSAPNDTQAMYTRQRFTPAEPAGISRLTPISCARAK